MNFPVPRVVNSSLADAIAAGCDCVMLKHDGFPVTINCAANTANVFSWLPPAGKTLEESVQLIEPLDALFVGARARLNPVVWLYDCWWMSGNDVQGLTYRERYVLTRTNARRLDERFVVVHVAPIQAAQAMWSDVAKDPDNLKGLVFRRSKDTAAGELYVKRFYKEAPEGLT